jgi:hypothetical protein
VGSQAYKKELGPERFKTIPLLEMVEEGKATFAIGAMSAPATASLTACVDTSYNKH